MPRTYREVVQDVAEQQGEYVQSVVSGYARQVSAMSNRAAGRLFASMVTRLDMNRGVIQPTANNRAILAGIESEFFSFMSDLGYEQLNGVFVSQFPGQFRFFEQILRQLSDAMKTPLRVEPLALDSLRALQLSTISVLESDLVIVGQQAARNALFSFNGLPFRDLVDLVQDRFDLIPSQAETVGVTSMSTYYRSLGEGGVSQIEQQLGVALSYGYFGPLDKLNRPFCKEKERQSRDGKSWTREQIDAMNNGSTLSNVFINCGGWNCRHQWAPIPPKRSNR